MKTKTQTIQEAYLATLHELDELYNKEPIPASATAALDIFRHKLLLALRWEEEV